VNDGSPDDTSEVARAFIASHPNQRFTLIETENRGLAEARNVGIRSTCTPWILPLDSDDVLAPEFLEKTLCAATKHIGASLVYTDLQMFGAAALCIVKKQYSPQLLLFENVFPYASLFRRELWDKAGGYSPIIPYGAEDWSFWIKCIRHGLNPIKVGEPLFFYRRQQTASMVDSVIAHQSEVDAFVHSCHPALYPAELLLSDHNTIAACASETQQCIEEHIRRFPSHYTLYLWRGLFRERLGQRQQAAEDFTKACALSAESDWQPMLRLLILNAHLGAQAAQSAKLARSILNLQPRLPMSAQLERMALG